MDEQRKEFTGVWIPKHIMEDGDLSWLQKGIYAQIASFEVCYQKYSTIAKIIGTGEDYVGQTVSILKEKGYIEDAGFDGRKKSWKALKDTPRRVRPVPRDGADPTSSTDVLLDNNIDTCGDESPRKRVPDDDYGKVVKPDRRVKDKQAIYALFSSKREPWMIHAHQRKAALELFDYGIDKVRKGLALMDENKEDKHCPQAYTPDQYIKKLPSLREYLRRKDL